MENIFVGPMLEPKPMIDLDTFSIDLYKPTVYFEEDQMLSPEYFGNYFDVVQANAEQTGGRRHAESKANCVNILDASLNASLNGSETYLHDLFYRHSMALTAVYCVVYLLVFALGLVGNFFVIAVVYRSPRMRTVTNFFIVNLAIADILVIVFCLPSTLMSNIFVRKEQVVKQYQEEIREGELVVNEEASSMQQLQQTVQAAGKAAQQSQAELKLLQTALTMAQGHAGNAQQVLDGTQQQLEEKEKILDAEKARLEELNKEVKTAKTDLTKTKDAAKRAEGAAMEAKQNANRNKRNRLQIRRRRK